MKSLLYIYFILLTATTIVHAQHSPEEISREYVAYAYDLIDIKDYDHALIKTDEIIALLPRSTAELQYIRALAHHYLDLDKEAKQEVEDMFNYPMTDELKLHADELMVLINHEIDKNNNPELHHDHVYNMAEVSARFPGGMGEFYTWFHGALHSHGIDREGKGRVYVSFIVTVYGKLDEVKIVKGVDDTIDLKVVELLSECPKWMCAMQNGKPVEQKLVLPLNLETHPY
ncbi:energy transducer TonB [Flammeovirga yaeyamensis]|uniref:Energy transducer TonB n=1 Tax=Flammeovirga yaeyamensis TaxID=367791 RepID=A0AAX1N782_9BACT|nr:energy transducer TonB [Flammeovirga yaeyamensis]MBB3697664.1 hypothetical protein [Flammeovirga yaeyamensis]NMF35976.1 hypothetical protein [Flammeovirga yaeyamensis]QWG03077.1 energy transducer TonB [Flammeovirga yaeyamensis]